MNIIERLKTNREAFGLMPEELRRVAEKIGRSEFLKRAYGEFVTTKSGQKWDTTDDDGKTFQLRPGWVCDHREQVILPTDPTKGASQQVLACAWCGASILPEKKGRWVEYEVKADVDGAYHIERAMSFDPFIDALPRMRGFGGTKYRAPCECYGGGETDFTVGPAPEPCKKHGPWKPVFVQFFEVGK